LRTTILEQHAPSFPTTAPPPCFKLNSNFKTVQNKYSYTHNSSNPDHHSTKFTQSLYTSNAIAQSCK